MINNVVESGVFDMGDPTQFIVASRLASYPSEVVRVDLFQLLSSGEVIENCRSAGDSSIWDDLVRRTMRAVASSEAWRSLASKYIDLFDRGSNENSLYETEYGLRRSQLKTGELADIAGFYKAFGFEMTGDSEQSEMIDHIAVESEFYALLIAKEKHLASKGEVEGASIVHSARVKFLQDHLGRYPEAVARRPGVASDPFYSLVFGWCASIIEMECQRLGVGIVPADYFDEKTDEEMLCGGNDLVSKIGISPSRSS